MSKEEYDANHIFSLSLVGFQTKEEERQLIYGHAEISVCFYVTGFLQDSKY